MSEPTSEPVPDLLGLVRVRCAQVAAAATSVTIDGERLAAYVSSLVDVRSNDDDRVDPWAAPVGGSGGGGRDGDERRAALVITLDAINFGSGYHPHVTKLPGLSGARTMATRLRTWEEEQGAIRAEALVGLPRPEVHRIFGQPETDEMVELMGLFATALDELGRVVIDEHDGSFLTLVAAAGRSANRLTALLAALPTYADVSTYGGVDVPLLKRAQITAADLHRAFHGAGPGTFDDIAELTAFADNLVPHVLRVDDVLVLDPELAASIDAGELLVHGRAPEVELRACGVHVVELLRAAVRAQGTELTAAQIDQILWSRGGGPRYKAVPRPRSRTTAY